MFHDDDDDDSNRISMISSSVRSLWAVLSASGRQSSSLESFLWRRRPLSTYFDFVDPCGRESETQLGSLMTPDDGQEAFNYHRFPFEQRR